MHDIDEMQRWYEKAANNGHARAQARLADSYRVIHNDIPDRKERAVKWAEASAEQGDAYGMFVLSQIYNDKDYPCYDPAKAEDWLKKAREASKNDPTINFGN